MDTAAAIHVATKSAMIAINLPAAVAQYETFLVSSKSNCDRTEAAGLSLSYQNSHWLQSYLDTAQCEAVTPTGAWLLLLELETNLREI